MPTAGGPNILGESNLVFAYDIGDVSNSYIGEPTVNIASGTITPYTPYNTLVRNGQNFTLTMVPGSAKYLTLHNGTDYVGQTLSYSGYMYKNGVPFNPLSTSTVPTTYQSSSGISNQFYNPETGYFKFTLYFNASSIWLFHQPVGAADNDIIQINNLQIEVKNHTTPFTTGTRSATQGLLPLIGNSTLDLSNVSFDSNAQMTFDGTDDLVDITTNFGTLSAYTFEYVAYANSTDNMPIASRTNTNFYKYGAYSWRYTHGGVGGEFYHTAGNGTGWAHWAITYDGSTISVWENGVSKGTSSSSGTADFSGGIRIGSWASSAAYTWDGTIPVMKMYNRALSAQEIKQNYQQYKTRFNLS